jgi:hypothetical protein
MKEKEMKCQRRWYGFLLKCFVMIEGFQVDGLRACLSYVSCSPLQLGEIVSGQGYKPAATASKRLA